MAQYPPSPKGGGGGVNYVITVVNTFYYDDNFSRQLPEKKDDCECGEEQMHVKKTALMQPKKNFIHHVHQRIVSTKLNFQNLPAFNQNGASCVYTIHQNKKLLQLVLAKRGYI